MTAVSLSQVCKSFGKAQPIIRDVNLQIGAGEFCVFLGPSGCGKSTLLRMIAGIESVSDGEVRIAGVRVNEMPPSQRKVAMVFQNYALYPHMTVRENMAFGLRQAKTPPPEIGRRVAEAAAILQIEHLLDRLPRALSGGQRQRVAIGRAIVRQPNVFLFDEPLSNLDAALRVHMRTEIARLHREFHRASAIYVTHDQTEAMALADKIVLMQAGQDVADRGSIAQTGTPLELYHRPRSLFVAAFLGSPRMGFLPATVATVAPSGIIVRLAGGELLRVAVPPEAATVGEAVTLGIRPEHMQPVSDGQTGQTITRPVRAVERFGEFSYVYLDGGEGISLIAKVAGDGPGGGTERLTVLLPASACHLFDRHGMAFPRLATG